MPCDSESTSDSESTPQTVSQWYRDDQYFEDVSEDIEGQGSSGYMPIQDLFDKLEAAEVDPNLDGAHQKLATEELLGLLDTAFDQLVTYTSGAGWYFFCDVAVRISGFLEKTAKVKWLRDRIAEKTHHCFDRLLSRSTESGTGLENGRALLFLRCVVEPILASKDGACIVSSTPFRRLEQIEREILNGL